jgi:hypothetical protein
LSTTRNHCSFAPFSDFAGQFFDMESLGYVVLAAWRHNLAYPVPEKLAIHGFSNEAAERRVPFMASDQLVANLTSPSNSGLASRGTALMADLQGLFPKAVVIRLVPAVFPAARSVESDLPGERFAFVDGAQITIQPGVTYRANGSLLIGDSQVLRAFHAEDGIPALEEGKVVAIGPDSADHGAVHVHRPPDANGNEELVDVPAVEAGETRFASLSSNGEFN